MKNKFAQISLSLLLTLTFALSANLAFAGNEGPQAAPQAPPRPTQNSPDHRNKPLPGFVVATIVTGGGMPMPGRCGMYTTTIYSTGSVISNQCEENFQLLTTVSQKWITYVLNKAANLKPVELVLLHPNAPQAADAGFSTSSVVNAQGDMIDFAGSSAARETVRITHRTDGSDKIREAFRLLQEKIAKSH